MKSVIQNYKTGELKVVETPLPQLRPGFVLVRTMYSLISAGTEKTKVDTARKSLIGKAMARPDLVKKLVVKARREGLWRAWETASTRLSQPMPMGYSSSGEIIAVQGDVNGLSCGDRVACGGNTANHAEIVCVPKNLVVPVPDKVGLDEAAFATLGAIAMQGVRLAEVQLGEKVAVIGLGLVGLLTVQLLKAAGCRVLGIDVDPGKVKLASDLGSDAVAMAGDESLEENVLVFTEGFGLDATLITAGTSSNGPIEQAGEITRERGRVVVVGATGLTVPREPYYMKEISLRISRSYGPGRYDPQYEEGGVDYPFGYVRFTEQRNMQSFLELQQSKHVRLDKIITHRFQIDDAPKAYDLIAGERKEPYLGILLEYPRQREEIVTRFELTPKPTANGKIKVGVIGAGNYATANLLPHLRGNDRLQLTSVCTGSGLSAPQVAERFGFHSVESDPKVVIDSSDALIVATRHNDHAAYAVQAIRAGKPVFVEKPLVISPAQLEEVITAAQESACGSVMVGFNRRFAPATELVLEHFSSVPGPRQGVIRVNAGPIPADHWIQNAQVGGGRLIGEGCHFFDLAIALTGQLIHRVQAMAIPKPRQPHSLWDDFSVQLAMADDSVVTIIYTAIGDSGLPKELIELSGGGRSAVIGDFTSVELWADGKRTRKTWSGQDKGQRRQMDFWSQALKEGRSAIPFDQIINVHRACFAAIASMQELRPISLQP